MYVLSDTTNQMHKERLKTVNTEGEKRTKKTLRCFYMVLLSFLLLQGHPVMTTVVTKIFCFCR